MKLKHFFTALLLIVAITFTPQVSHAGEDPGFGDPDDPLPEDTNVPFDDYIGVLLAAGVAYGLKKKYDASKQVAAE